MEDREELPTLALKDIPPVVGELKMELKCASPIKSGISKWGLWHLWIGRVNNCKVTHGRKPNTRIEKNYSGEVLFFPSEIANKTLIKLADNKIGAEVLIKQEITQTEHGFTNSYKIEKLSDGHEISQSNLTPFEIKLLNDTKSFVDEGRNIDEATFITVSKEEMYGGNISKDRAEELFKILTSLK